MLMGNLSGGGIKIWQMTMENGAAKMVIAKTLVQIHIEIWGNHSCMSNAAAVNSVPSVAVHVSQYNHEIMYPVPGPI